GSVGIRITTGSLRSCARFAGASVRRDQAGLFIAVQTPSSALADCSNESLGGLPPSTTTTTTRPPTTTPPPPTTTTTLPPTTTTTTTTPTTTTTAPTTTTTSTTPTTTTTATTLLPLPPLTVEFAGGAPSGNCGATHDGSANVLDTLACGSLSLGGGAA